MNDQKFRRSGPDKLGLHNYGQTNRIIFIFYNLTPTLSRQWNIKSEGSTVWMEWKLCRFLDKKFRSKCGNISFSGYQLYFSPTKIKILKLWIKWKEKFYTCKWHLHLWRQYPYVLTFLHWYVGPVHLKDLGGVRPVL